MCFPAQWTFHGNSHGNITRDVILLHEYYFLSDCSSLRVHFRLIPKVNYAVARTQMVELDRNWHQNWHRNRHFFRLCVVNCCDIFVQCDIRASFEMMEKMVTYSGKSRIFYPRFLEGNPKLHSLNQHLVLPTWMNLYKTLVSFTMGTKCFLQMRTCFWYV